MFHFAQLFLKKRLNILKEAYSISDWLAPDLSYISFEEMIYKTFPQEYSIVSTENLFSLKPWSV